MSVYVDSLCAIESRDPEAFRVGRKHGHRWCHMFADTEAELLAMGDRIGMRRIWLQRGSVTHFDLVPPRRAKAIALGAIEVNRNEAVAIWRRLRGAPNQPDAQRSGT